MAGASQNHFMVEETHSMVELTKMSNVHASIVVGYTTGLFVYPSDRNDKISLILNVI